MVRPIPALRDALLEREELIGEEILEVLRRAEAEAGQRQPLPARGAPSLLARRPAPPAALADPGRDG
jgi:hypothetical protein